MFKSLFVCALLFFGNQVIAQTAPAVQLKTACDVKTVGKCRIRIVTLLEPKPWQSIPIDFIVEPENGKFVFYSKQEGNWCEMTELLNSKLKNSVYTDARIVVKP